jgi:hypothetical protein
MIARWSEPGSYVDIEASARTHGVTDDDIIQRYAPRSADAPAVSRACPSLDIRRPQRGGMTRAVEQDTRPQAIPDPTAHRRRFCAVSTAG